MDEFVGLLSTREVSPEASRRGLKIMQELLEEYGITQAEFDDIQTGMHSQGSFDFPFWYVSTDEAGITLKIPSDIKKVDYIAAWDDIYEILHPPYLKGPFTDDEEVVIAKRQTRRRPPDDTRLVYAIHRARIKGLTFRNIFELYQEGGLPGYANMPTNNYSSEDSLERYYNKYKPDR